jgi:hypothetical protein
VRQAGDDIYTYIIAAGLNLWNVNSSMAQQLKLEELLPQVANRDRGKDG